MRAVELVVTGRVQGVFYRATCRDEAQRLGVAGWVANREDGAVVGRFEGQPDAVSELVDWCRVGPRAAYVEDVAVTEVEPLGAIGFDVRN